MFLSQVTAKKTFSKVSYLVTAEADLFSCCYKSNFFFLVLCARCCADGFFFLKWSKSLKSLFCLSNCFLSFRNVCVPSGGKGGCGGLWGCDCRPVGGGPDPGQRETERLLFGLLRRIRSRRPLWEWTWVGLLWELQPRHAMHKWWERKINGCCEGKKSYNVAPKPVSKISS